MENELGRQGPRILPPSRMSQLESLSTFPTDLGGIQGRFLRRICSVHPMQQLKFDGIDGNTRSIAEMGRLLRTRIGESQVGSSVEDLYIEVPELSDEDWGMAGNLAQYHRKNPL